MVIYGLSHVRFSEMYFWWSNISCRIDSRFLVPALILNPFFDLFLLFDALPRNIQKCDQVLLFLMLKRYGWGLHQQLECFLDQNSIQFSWFAYGSELSKELKCSSDAIDSDICFSGMIGLSLQRKALKAEVILLIISISLTASVVQMNYCTALQCQGQKTILLIGYPRIFMKLWKSYHNTSIPACWDIEISFLSMICSIDAAHSIWFQFQQIYKVCHFLQPTKITFIYGHWLIF